MVNQYVCRLEIVIGRKRPAIGFQVRIPQYGVSCWFGAKKHGGVAKAEAAALAFRDKTMRKPPTPAMKRAYSRRVRLEREKRATRRQTRSKERKVA